MDPLWYKRAVIYEVHLRAFYDSNADGIGDINGLIEKLPYLQELGVNCLWLLPMYPSPLRDDGYDIADYYNIHPDYGSLNDFQRLVDEAHRRDIRILTELVVNHTSDAHPWFQEARRDPKSPKRDWYVWSDTDEQYKGVRIIFTDTERSNWTWDPVAKQYFWHRFFSHQPDLNYDNPEVQEEMFRILKFWMDLGVDGFRCDAVPYLFEREGTICENLPETHAFLKRLRAKMEAEYPGRMLLAEANQWPADVRVYFGEGDEFHMGFHFPVMPRLFMGIRREERTPIVEILQQTPEIPETCQWAIFLRNHDELTLEMVTDEERDYMYREYAMDPRMRINVGIRRRLAPLMDNGRRRIELMHALLFTLPGTPVLYYGDEIGMGDNIYLGDRNGVRTPMQWTSDRNAGFSRADAARLYAPVIADPVYGYQSINVEAQVRMKTSLLAWVRELLRIRAEYPVFSTGKFQFLFPENRKVLAYVRSDAEATVLCLFNLAKDPQPVELDLSPWRGHTPVELQGNTPFPEIRVAPYQLALDRYGFLWLRLDAPRAP
ncbi:MAG: maltose alpha-D-glucosyltransferase [Myxococcota bacterium]|nr:maltose alpha-D-glucosyltransferase [Myxococcota bacterium]